ELLITRPRTSTLFPYTTLFRSEPSEESSEANTERIVSLNGAITETLAALDYSDAIVGVDVTSTYPENLKEKVTDLGHVRSISVRSEEHTSELQSRENLVCRLML